MGDLTLTEFLLAQIAQDEAMAQEARDGSARDWAEADEDAGCKCCVLVLGLGVVVDDRQAPHIVRWDPARVLAECAAKRAIIDWDCMFDGGVVDGSSMENDRVLWLLAQPYADHPDFDPAWLTE
jgi:hypothetical protein